MPVNKHALIRYKTIDQCLQNRFRKWTLEDLMEACSDALYEFEGITKGISKRTVQLDLQTMRSEKLGYNAPIVVADKKFYSYSDRNYSITNIPLTSHDLEKLNHAMSLLKQFKGFGYFDELGVMISKLEDKVSHVSSNKKSFIHLEKNELLKGLQFIDPLHKAIIQKTPVEINYQSYKAKEPSPVVVYPYLLKEYRNRWFLLCANPKMLMVTFALDRIQDVTLKSDMLYKKSPVDVYAFYDEMVGVTRSVNERPVDVTIKVTLDHAPYLLTKPIHHTQKILKKLDDGIILTFKVIHNLELERELLGFGAHIEIFGPRKLKSRLIKTLRDTLNKYHVG